jgi:hypothetical protein
MTDIVQLVAEFYGRSYDEPVNFNLQHLALNVDPLTVPPLRNTRFYIERRLQRPYSENRYESGAPLRTEDHIALLEAIEHRLLGN